MAGIGPGPGVLAESDLWPQDGFDPGVGIDDDAIVVSRHGTEGQSGGVGLFQFVNDDEFHHVGSKDEAGDLGLQTLVFVALQGAGTTHLAPVVGERWAIGKSQAGRGIEFGWEAGTQADPMRQICRALGTTARNEQVDRKGEIGRRRRDIDILVETGASLLETPVT